LKTNRDKAIAIVGTVVLIIVALIFVWTQPAIAHNPPCTIVYEGVPTEPFCQTQEIPDPADGTKTITVFICR
jgi:hypothetical protein